MLRLALSSLLRLRWAIPLSGGGPVVIEFPKRDVISQEELKPVCAVEGQLDEMLEVLYRRFAAGARIEPGTLTLNMRRRPIRAVDEKERRVG